MGGWMCGRSIRGELASPARSASGSWRSMTTARNGRGGIWTVAGSSPYVHADPPRVDCPDHGVRQVRLPWAEPSSRFTMLFERLAIDVLKECDVTGAARLLHLSWDEAWHLMDRAVARGLAAKPQVVPARIGVVEKSAGRGQDYITVVSDLDRGTAHYLVDERRQASLDSTSTVSPPSSRPVSRRSRWTCGSPTSTQPEPTSTTLTRRSCSTVTT